MVNQVAVAAMLRYSTMQSLMEIIVPVVKG
jgi:hypothetical protein